MTTEEMFHNLYEKYAPEFGYETRKDTKKFTPDSPNGKLMQKVCKEIEASIRKEVVEEKDDLLDDMWGLICNVNGGNVENEKEEWYQAFLRIRDKYFKQLTN